MKITVKHRYYVRNPTNEKIISNESWMGETTLKKAKSTGWVKTHHYKNYKKKVMKIDYELNNYIIEKIYHIVVEK